MEPNIMRVFEAAGLAPECHFRTRTWTLVDGTTILFSEHLESERIWREELQSLEDIPKMLALYGASRPTFVKACCLLLSGW